MRLIAQLLNVALLVTMLYIVKEEGIREHYLLWFLIFSAPISALLVMSGFGSDNVVSLYFKRKALEEQAKIDGLKK